MSAHYPKATIRSLNTSPATYQIEKIIGGTQLAITGDWPFCVGDIVTQSQASRISEKYLTTTLMPRGG